MTNDQTSRAKGAFKAKSIGQIMSVGELVPALASLDSQFENLDDAVAGSWIDEFDEIGSRQAPVDILPFVLACFVG